MASSSLEDNDSDEETISSEVVTKIRDSTVSQYNQLLTTSSAAASSSSPLEGFQSLLTESLSSVQRCVVCLCTIKSTVAVWNCGTCFVMLHLSCLARYDFSSFFPLSFKFTHFFFLKDGFNKEFDKVMH